VILGGTNDLFGTEENEILGSLQQMHQLLHKHGAITIAVTIPEPKIEPSVPQIRPKREGINAALARIASESQGRVLLLDLATKIPRNSLTMEEQRRFWDDALHLSAFGYDHFGALVYEVLEPLL